MQSGLKGPDQRRLVQPENTQALFIEVCVFVFRGCVMHSNDGRNKPKSQRAAEGVRQALWRCFYSCLLASSLLTLPSIDLIQLRIFFQYVLHCGNNCLLTEEKGWLVKVRAVR